jgi:polar amino acid transport system substrate-binding protein
MKSKFVSRLLPKSLSVMLLALLLVGCSGSMSRSPAGIEKEPLGTLSKVQQTHHLKAGYIKYPPFVIQDPATGQLSGYFIDLMANIAKEGGFTVDYEETNWGTMVAGLESGKFDIVVSGVFRTIPRAEQVTFTEPVLYVGISAVARKNDARFRTVADLSQKGLKIAVTNGEVGHEYAKKYLPEADLTVINTEDISRPMLEVLSGRADVALGDSMTTYLFTKQHPEVKDVFAANPFYVYGTTFMVRRHDQEWLDFLNIAIEEMELSGVTDRLEAKYKEGTAWISKRKPWQ